MDEKDPVYFEVCWREDGGLCGPVGGVSTRGGLTTEQARAAAERMGRELFGDRAVVREGSDPDGWGFGAGAQREGWKTFDRVKIGRHEAELAFGEHPHGRRDENIYARIGGERGYVVGFSGHRPLITVEVKEENYVKTSGLSGDDVRGTCTAVVRANGYVVLRVTGRKLDYVLTGVLAELPKRMEHAIHPWRAEDREKVAGRRVYYRDTPAVIERVDWETLEVTVRAAGEGRFPLWAHHQEDKAEGGDRALDYDGLSERVGLYDERLSWHRDALVDGEAS